MGAQTTLSEKGQVVIPKDVRDALGFRPGQILDVIRMGGGVMLKPQHKKSGRTFEEIDAEIREIAGQWDGPPATISEMDAAVDDMFRSEWDASR